VDLVLSTSAASPGGTTPAYHSLHMSIHVSLCHTPFREKDDRLLMSVGRVPLLGAPLPWPQGWLYIIGARFALMSNGLHIFLLYHALQFPSKEKSYNYMLCIVK
jgi:hypothetical protein